MPNLKLTPNQLLDQVMEQELPSHLQTNLYTLIKSFDQTTTQNKLLLMLCMGLMAEFDQESSESVLDGLAKVSVSKGTLERISKKIATKGEKPILCYNEEGDEGFIMIKWNKPDEGTLHPYHVVG